MTPVFFPMCVSGKLNPQVSPNYITFARNLHMINDMITKFLEPAHLEKKAVKIEFKKRNTMIGIFVKSNDYEDLKSKNFWRIVSEVKIPEWKKTNDSKLSKIFSGSEFTRLTMAKEQ